MLGYDFRVGTGRSPRLFEVKATQGDGGRIELGTTEVAAAQRHAGSNQWRLLVVTSVFDPEQWRIRLLPNPFTAQGRKLFREDGGALVYAYRFAT